MNCDCDATPEDIAAGIHFNGCTSHDGTPDDPSDHWGHASLTARKAAMLSNPTPYGCAHCGIARDRHGRRYLPGIGIHQWRTPDDTVIKQRMLARRHARLSAEPPKYHATTAWAADHTGESADPYCADCKSDGCRLWLRVQARLDRDRWALPHRTGRTSGGWGGDEPW